MSVEWWWSLPLEERERLNKIDLEKVEFWCDMFEV